MKAVVYADSRNNAPRFQVVYHCEYLSQVKVVLHVCTLIRLVVCSDLLIHRLHQVAGSNIPKDLIVH